MAHATLPALSHPEFPQVFPDEMRCFVEGVCRVTDQRFLSTCSYEHPETHAGACDGQPCSEKGTVHDLVTDQSYCVRHFWEVRRG